MIRSVLRGMGCVTLAMLLSVASVATAQNDQLARGKYLVMHVAMCVYCHTPRTQQGELDQSQLLQGAPMPLASPFPLQTWAFEAPKIAGLPGGWTEADLSQLLQTGRGPRGMSPRPPMPPFRMTQEDAAAVAAYLKSLQ